MATVAAVAGEFVRGPVHLSTLIPVLKAAHCSLTTQAPRHPQPLPLQMPTNDCKKENHAKQQCGFKGIYAGSVARIRNQNRLKRKYLNVSL